jgi:hypothetical protein
MVCVPTHHHEYFILVVGTLRYSGWFVGTHITALILGSGDIEVLVVVCEDTNHGVFSFNIKTAA